MCMHIYIYQLKLYYAVVKHLCILHTIKNLRHDHTNKKDIRSCMILTVLLEYIDTRTVLSGVSIYGKCWQPINTYHHNLLLLRITFANFIVAMKSSSV